MSAPKDLEVYQTHQAARLIRGLKNSAFDMSPAFQNNLVDQFDTTKSFYLKSPGSDATQARLKLGFEAFRTLGRFTKPGYNFTIKASLEEETDSVPLHIIPYLDKTTAEELETVDEDDLSQKYTITYEISQFGKRFLEVTNAYELNLYGDTVYFASTDDFHLVQAGNRVEIPPCESKDNDPSIIIPSGVGSPLEEIVDSSDCYSDAVEKLERALAVRAIFEFNKLDITQGFYDFSTAIEEVRLLMRELHVGDLKKEHRKKIVSFIHSHPIKNVSEAEPQEE